MKSVKSRAQQQSETSSECEVCVDLLESAGTAKVNYCQTDHATRYYCPAFRRTSLQDRVEDTNDSLSEHARQMAEVGSYEL
jgi:hypothetical protein